PCTRTGCFEAVSCRQLTSVGCKIISGCVVITSLAPLPKCTPGGELKWAAFKDAGKNAPAIEGLQQLLARICGGCDASQIPGLSSYLVLQLISEAGTDMTQWRTEKHFTSWLGLAGARKQSGKRKGNFKAHRNRAGRL